jgi:ribokinase
MYDFLAIGDTQLDTVMVLDPEEVEIKCQLKSDDCLMCLDYASKVPASQCYEMVAGNAANAAVTGARLDGKTAFWTLLGHDDIATKQIEHFKSEGIDISLVEQQPSAQSHRSVVISVSGERTILVYHAPRKYSLPVDLPSAKWVYLTSMAKGSETIFEPLSAYVAKTGAKVVYQPGTFQLRLGAAAASELLRVTEVIVMNKEEAELYTDHKDATMRELLDALRKLGPKIAVITDSTKGSYASDGTDYWYLETRPEIPRIEATGAGDAFSSALTVALLEGQSLPEAMRWGTFNAESVIQKIGPQAGILTKTQLQEDIASNPQFQTVAMKEAA